MEKTDLNLTQLKTVNLGLRISIFHKGILKKFSAKHHVKQSDAVRYAIEKLEKEL